MLIHHDKLDRTVDVPESTAAVLCAGDSGWKPATKKLTDQVQSGEVTIDGPPAPGADAATTA